MARCQAGGAQGEHEPAGEQGHDTQHGRPAAFQLATRTAKNGLRPLPRDAEYDHDQHERSHEAHVEQHQQPELARSVEPESMIAPIAARDGNAVGSSTAVIPAPSSALDWPSVPTAGGTRPDNRRRNHHSHVAATRSATPTTISAM
jgi:hypothetical protein